MALLVLTTTERGAEFAGAVRALGMEGKVRVWPDAGALADIRYALAWRPPPGVLARLPNLRLVISVGAGVDHLLADPDLPDVPIVRFVDRDLTQRMTAYVTLHVLLHTRRMCEFAEQQRKTCWRVLPEPLAREVRVGLMGLGVMGQAAARALRASGFAVRGWARSAHRIEDVRSYAGPSELDAFLTETDVLVALLPLTPETAGLIDRRVLRTLSRAGRSDRLPGPVFINAGRGGLHVEADILDALEAGELYAASLDVFETEPLPATSPLWRHPRVIVTPHCAAETSARAIARYAAAQIRALESGEPLENLVDRTRGY